MKTLLSTTAMVLALGFPAMTLAQEAAPEAGSHAQAQSGDMSGFMAERGQSDINASDLMGHDVYARRNTDETGASGDEASNSQAESDDGTPAMAGMDISDLDEMDNIGQINEIVLSKDGQVRALVIGVGGFLGMGERDVAVTMDQITFAYDKDDASEMYVVVNSGSDMLEDAPEYDRTAMQGNASGDTDRMAANDAADTGSDETPTERSALTAPDMEREGYQQVEGTELTTEMLMGKTVYDVNENDVGTVTDIVLSDAGEGNDVIIDFGGFLGMGKSQVAIAYDELTFLINDDDDIRLYVDATKEQIQNRQQRSSI